MPQLTSADGISASNDLVDQRSDRVMFRDLYVGPSRIFMCGGGILVGVVLAGTGLMRTCPAYSIFGIRTCKV